MNGHIDKAINYLKLYKLDHNPDYLAMACHEIKDESVERKRPWTLQYPKPNK